MFKDDLDLVAMAVEKWGPLQPPFVEVGGLESPTIADYALTIDAMAKLEAGADEWIGRNVMDATPEQRAYILRDAIGKAQQARYLQIHRPLDKWLPGYRCEDPGNGGRSIRHVAESDERWGAVVCLSVLEHVEDPTEAVGHMRDMLAPGGLLIVSVPFQFPYHPSPNDYWRFTPDALRLLLDDKEWEVLFCDWRLRIPADAGVLERTTGRPQAIESCALVARAI